MNTSDIITEKCGTVIGFCDCDGEIQMGSIDTAQPLEYQVSCLIARTWNRAIMVGMERKAAEIRAIIGAANNKQVQP